MRVLIVVLVAQVVLAAVTFLFLKPAIDRSRRSAQKTPDEPPGAFVLEVAWQDVAYELIKLQEKSQVPLSKTQAKIILPHFRNLSDHKDRLFAAERSTVLFFTPKQQAFIKKHRWDLLMNHPLPEDLSRGQEKDVALPVRAALQIIRKKAALHEKAAPIVEQGRGKDIISWLHLSQGILVMEKRPSLAVSPAQAAGMLRPMEELLVQLEGLCAEKSAILEALTPGQIAWMQEEKKKRTGMAPRYPMMESEPDYQGVTRMLEEIALK
jgi:hypothetical protein